MINYDLLGKYAETVRAKLGIDPKVAIILGSGLGELAESINVVYTLSYDQIENFPVSTIEGHIGQFVFGYINETPVVCMQGRVHFYEGYSMESVVLPVRFMAMLGAKYLLVTNAAGGINPDLSAGDIMMISDHISTFVDNSLVGRNLDFLGTRFPDMTEVYDKKLRQKLEDIAKANDIALKQGVYVQLSGPSFETPAEIRMLGMLGADAVGMSTVCETIAARHCGMRVCGISCITNKAAGLAGKKLSHSDVKVCADMAGKKMKTLVFKLCEKIDD